jgi:BspA type Leucine rich repeat region (6 copies)
MISQLQSNFAKKSFSASWQVFCALCYFITLSLFANNTDYNDSSMKGCLFYNLYHTGSDFIMIVGCIPDTYGEVNIPEKIDGYPVTEIGGAFTWCRHLTNITIPSSVKRIGHNSFEHCESLTDITIPKSVTDIEDKAFSDCKNLKRVEFLGNAPSMGKYVFDDTSSGFTMIFHKNATGFTSPTWNGYRSEQQ